MTLELAERTPRVAVGCAGPVVITTFVKQPVPDDMDFIERVAAPVRAAHPRFASITLYGRGVPFPDQETRDRAAVVSRRNHAQVDVIVIEGSDLRAASARAVLIGIYMVSRTKQHKVSKSVDEAIQIVADEMPTDLLALQRGWAAYQTWLASEATSLANGATPRTTKT